MPQDRLTLGEQEREEQARHEEPAAGPGELTERDDEMEPGVDDEMDLDDETSLEDERPVAPHGYHALHDMHDYLGAGHDAVNEHLQLADNPKVREALEDVQAQLAAMADELRELCGGEYPDHEPPMALEMDANGEEEETPLAEEEAGEPLQEEDEDEEDDEDMTAKTRKTRKDDEEDEDEDEGKTEKSLTKSALVALDRKFQRYQSLAENEISRLENELEALRGQPA